MREAGYHPECCRNDTQDHCAGDGLCLVGCRCHDDTTNDDAVYPVGSRVLKLPVSSYRASVDGDVPLPPHSLAVLFHGMRHGTGQTEAILSKSGLIGAPSDVMAHHPFLVLDTDARGSTVNVRVVRSVNFALEFTSDTVLMLQWPGQYRSDWFMFTVGDLRDFLDRQREVLRGDGGSRG